MSSNKFQSKYKQTHTFEYRKSQADRIRERHPDRLPVICEKVESSDIADLEFNKLLIPSDASVGLLVRIVRKGVMVGPEKAVFLFLGNSVPANSVPMSVLYAKYKDEDGFLYMKYSGENTFG
jgi:GABA(A) receptor-associated protein